MAVRLSLSAVVQSCLLCVVKGAPADPAATAAPGACPTFSTADTQVRGSGGGFLVFLFLLKTPGFIFAVSFQHFCRRNITLMFHNIPTVLCQNQQSRKISLRADISLNNKLFPHAILYLRCFPINKCSGSGETESMRNWETWSCTSSRLCSSPAVTRSEQAARVSPVASSANPSQRLLYQLILLLI